MALVETLKKRTFLAVAEGAEVTSREGAAVSPAVAPRARAIAEALFATAEGPPAPERLDWLSKDLTHFLAHAGGWARFVIGLCMYITCVLGPLLSFKVGFVGRSLEERRAILERLEQSPAALAFLAVRAILCIVYYEHPEVSKEIGFDGVCHSGRSWK
jgi:hypothetical protein